MATAIPLTVQKGPRYLPKNWMQQREVRAKLQDQRRAEAAFEKQAMVKFETFDFINDFLHNSEWKDLLEQITIAWDSLPSKFEVMSLGRLGRVEGTRACRKLFKAPVIWDDLGCSFWEYLSGNSNTHRNGSILELPEDEEESGLDSEQEQLYTLDSHYFTRTQSVSSRVSRDDSAGSSSSRHSSTEREDNGRTLERVPSLLFKGRQPKERSARRSTDPNPSYDARSGFPRILSHNVKRTMGHFGESMIQGHGGRGSL